MTFHDDFRSYTLAAESSAGSLIKYSLSIPLTKLVSALALEIFGNNIDSIWFQLVNIVNICIRCGCSGLDPPLWVLYSVMKERHSDWVSKRGTPLVNREVASSLYFWYEVYVSEENGIDYM